MKLLIVIDMQNDFIDGALGTAEAVKIVPAVADKLAARRAGGWEGPLTPGLPTDPPLRGMKRERQLRKVVLPHPVGPTMHSISPL